MQTNNDEKDEHAELYPHCYFEFSLCTLLKITNPVQFLTKNFKYLTPSQLLEMDYFKMKSPIPLITRILFHKQPENNQDLEDEEGKEFRKSDGLAFYQAHDQKWLYQSVATCQTCFTVINHRLE